MSGPGVPAAGAEPLLRTEALVCTYGPVIALRHAEIEVRAGEVVCVLGVNGAGKTTLLAAVAGLVRPSSGTIALDGENLSGRSPEDVARLGVALVPEGRRVFPTLSVRENLLLGGYLARKDSAELRSRMEEVLSVFPLLQRWMARAAGSLSGGEQQMLAIGRGLMARPRLLMLDEPSLGLAPILVERMMEVVRELATGSRAVLLVEQLARLALQSADRGYLLEAGRVQLSGSSAELQADDRVREIYMGVKR